MHRFQGVEYGHPWGTIIQSTTGTKDTKKNLRQLLSSRSSYIIELKRHVDKKERKQILVHVRLHDLGPLEKYKQSALG